MRRYLDRVLVREPRDPSHHLSEYQDDVWLFFPNCWHLKDWVRSDLLIEPDGKARNTAAVEASRMLASPMTRRLQPSIWSYAAREDNPAPSLTARSG